MAPEQPTRAIIVRKHPERSASSGKARCSLLALLSDFLEISPIFWHLYWFYSSTLQFWPIPHKNVPPHRTVFSVTPSVCNHTLGVSDPVFNPSQFFFHDGNAVTPLPPSSLSTTEFCTLILLFRYVSDDGSTSSPSVALPFPLFSAFTSLEDFNCKHTQNLSVSRPLPRSPLSPLNKQLLR